MTKIDLDISHWELREQLAYREKVEVNPQYAYAEIVDAFFARSSGASENAVLNIPPQYLIGFVWVTGKRDKPSLTWDEVIAEFRYDDLLEAFTDAFRPIVDKLLAEAEEDEEDRPTKAGEGSKSSTRKPHSSHRRKS